MAKRRSPVEESIYDFDPDDIRDQSTRAIALEGNNSSVMLLPATPDQAEISNPAQTAAQSDAGQRWAKLIKQILTADYLAILITTLRNDSSLIELVTTHLFQHLVKIYQHKVEAAIQIQGIDSINTSLSHFKLITNRKQNTKKLELVFDDERIKGYLRNSLAAFFNHAGFWEEFAKSIGTNLVIWAIESLKQVGGTSLEDLNDEQLFQAITQHLQILDSPALQERINFFGQLYCQDISKKIIQGFNLPDCSLQDMDKLLGLSQKPPSATEI
ncbi:MAG TPA: hypothetical protein V6C57_19280, partial [Coleofasciculaceae cyanobacterium]